LKTEDSDACTEVKCPMLLEPASEN